MFIGKTNRPLYCGVFWHLLKGCLSYLLTLKSSNLKIPSWNIPFGKLLHNYGKSPFFMGKSTISMAMFNSYVSLPRGYQSEFFPLEHVFFFHCDMFAAGRHHLGSLRGRDPLSLSCIVFCICNICIIYTVCRCSHIHIDLWWFLWLCVSIDIHSNIYTWLNINKKHNHTWSYMYICTAIFACLYVSIATYTYIYIIYIYTHNIYMLICIRIYKSMQMCLITCRFAYTCICIYIYFHIKCTPVCVFLYKYTHVYL